LGWSVSWGLFSVGFNGSVHHFELTDSVTVALSQFLANPFAVPSDDSKKHANY